MSASQLPEGKRLPTGRDMMKRLCELMGLEVLPETEAVMGDKLDQEWSDSWRENDALSKHVRSRSKAMFAYLNARREQSHKQALEEMRANGTIPMLSETDRKVAEKALKEARKQLKEGPAPICGTRAAGAGAGAGAGPSTRPGTATGASAGTGSGVGARAVAGVDTNPRADVALVRSSGHLDVPAPAPHLQSAASVAQSARQRGNVNLDAKERALLMEDRKNVFYDWEYGESYSELNWRDMQTMVCTFTHAYRRMRAEHLTLTDEEIRELLKQDSEMDARSKRLPMMFRLCTSRKSDAKVFEAFKKVIAGRKAIQEGMMTEEQVYPIVFYELAELFKCDRALTEEEQRGAARFESVDDALRVGPRCIEALQLQQQQQQQQQQDDGQPSSRVV